MHQVFAVAQIDIVVRLAVILTEESAHNREHHFVVQSDAVRAYIKGI